MDERFRMWDVHATGIMHEGTMQETTYSFFKQWYGPDAGQVAIAFIDSYPADMRFVEIHVKESVRNE